MKYPKFNTSQVPSLEEAIKITREKEKLDNKEGLYVDSVGTIFTTLKQKDDFISHAHFHVNSNGIVVDGATWRIEQMRMRIEQIMSKHANFRKK